MPVNPFVRALSLTRFQEFATQQLLDPTALLRQAAIPLDVLRRPENIYSYQRYCALLELSSKQSRNPLFGLQYGMFQGVDVFSELLVLIHNAQTVAAALSELSENYALYNGAARVQLHVVAAVATLSYEIGDPKLAGRCQAEELACAVGIQLMRALLGSQWQPKAIRFRHLPLADESRYIEVLGLAPLFAADCVSLEFDAAELAHPLHAADETLRQLVAEHMAKIERLSADELPNYVRQLLRHLLPSGRATFEKVADCMALSPRTLRVRLKNEGTSFQLLLDETRQTMARHYLQDPNFSMTQLARLLGYADASSFSRAFKRWFALNPLAWQKKNQIQKRPRLLCRRL